MPISVFSADSADSRLCAKGSALKKARKLLLPASALALSSALTVGLPATAGAATTTGAPSGYRVAFGPILTVADGTQGRSTVSCPKGTVPLGGGLFVGVVSLTTGVSSSFPTANGWTGVMNNQSGEPGLFQVAVTCARKPAHYSVVVSKPVVNPTLHRTTVTVSCPKVANPLGGGSQASGGFFANLGGSRPFQNGWRITEENATANLRTPAAVPTVKAFVVCGSLPNYRLVTGKPRTVPPLSQALVTATCPGGSVVLGGGASINAKVLGVNFSMTAPIDPTAALTGSTTREPFAWETIVNNNNEVNASTSPFAICAGR
jgi:hypothetical protein